MSGYSQNRPFGFHVLVAVLVFQGLTGVIGGLELARDPSGATLRIPLQWLEGSPFADYLVPGLVLLTVLGLVPLLVAYGLWNRRPWSRAGALFVGLSLIAWLAVEIAVVGYVSEPPFQLLYGIVAGLIVVLTCVPSAIRGR